MTINPKSYLWSVYLGFATDQTVRYLMPFLFLHLMGKMFDEIKKWN